MEDIKTLSDENLIARFKCGDGVACEELLNRYKNKVLAIARSYFLSYGDTEDLVQEGMCGLYSAMSAYSGEGAFAPFAYACVRNRIIDALKHVVRGIPQADYQTFLDEQECGASHGFTPEDVLINTESKNEFSEVIKSALSDLELKALEMYVDGATMGEMTEVLGKTYKQIDNALDRAKRKLKNIRKK